MVRRIGATGVRDAAQIAEIAVKQRLAVGRLGWKPLSVLTDGGPSLPVGHALPARVRLRAEPQSVSALRVTIVPHTASALSRASVRSQPEGTLPDGVQRGEVV
jgi:hypothetical protein